MTDQFEWWRSALQGNVNPISDGNPQPGYYKLRNGRDGPWLPVAIWYKGDDLVCRVAGDQRDPLDVWTWCAKNPVEKEAARHAFQTGSWPGDIPTIGDNSGTLSLPEEIDDVAQQASDWLRKTQIADKISADTAANWRAKLLDLGKQADAQRTAEKKPHDDAAKAVQAKWKPVIDVATDAANKLRDALTAYMREEEAKLRTEQVDPVRVQAGGQRGRKTGLRTITVYDVTDYTAALAYVSDHPDVRAAVEKVCRAMAKAGTKVPGIETREEKVAA